MRPPYFGGVPQQRNRPSVPRGGLSNQQRMGGNRMSGIQNRGGVSSQSSQQQLPRTQPQGYKITSSARNQPGSQGAGGDILSGGPQPLSVTELSKADPHQQKQIIGEHLYRAIEPLNPSKAGKITGTKD